MIPESENKFLIKGFLIIRFTFNYTSKSFRCMTKEVTLYFFNCM